VWEDIHARALTLYDGQRRLVIVTYDLNCLDVATPLLRARCRDGLGIEPAYLVLLATHNHAAPIQIVPANSDYGRWLAERLFALIAEAIAAERGPARLWFGNGRGPALMSVGGHPVDDEVQVLKVTVEDETRAILFNQPTHPLQASFWRIEPGHPGYAMDEIERRLPGVQAMYADAAGGNQFLATGTLMLWPKPLVKLIGKDLAGRALRISAGPLMEITGPLSARREVIPLPLAPAIPYEEAQKLARNIPRDIGLVPYPHPDRESNWLRSLLHHYEAGIPFPATTADRVCTDEGFLVSAAEYPREFPCVYEETIVATIGPLVFVAMQGEVCAPIGAAIKETYRGRRPIMVFAYMGEHNLYIPTRALVRQKAYQAKVLQSQYASPVGWSEEVEDAMVEGVKGIIERALAGAP
jgi:hypothetical protein